MTNATKGWNSFNKTPVSLRTVLNMPLWAIAGCEQSSRSIRASGARI